MNCLARAFVCAAVAMLLTAASSYQVNYGTNQDITEWSTCKNVSNASPTGKALFVPTNSSTEWSQFYTHAPTGVTISNCGCAVTAGSQTYSTAGSFTFTVPCHNNLTVQVWGGGGGGATSYYNGVTNGGNGGQSSFNGSVIAGGGSGGKGGTSTKQGTGGAGGTASGGSTNTSGGAGANGTSTQTSAGGNSPNGGAGAPTVSGSVDGSPGSAPGGGGAGGGMLYSGGGGGGGAYSTKSYSAGIFIVGSSIAVVVGAAGTGGTKASAKSGGSGAVGGVTITWN